MDIIIKSQLNEFVNEFDYKDLPTDEAFERYCNYCVFSKEYGNEPLESFEIEQSAIGKSYDNGIDGIAIIANGKLIYTEEEITLLATQNGYLNVTFCFLQSKTSSSFSSEEIGTFLFGVKDMFSDLNEPIQHPNWNKQINHYHELVLHIYSFGAKMTNELPKLKLFYVCTGVWRDTHIDAKSRFERDKRELEKTELFSTVSYHPVDAKELQKLYTQTKNKVTADIKLINKITLPEIKGVGEAYYGLIPFSEYKKIIIDDDGYLKNVFYDNVRAFQGLNNVNLNIDKTLKDKKNYLFPLLNNGVTLIAKEITPVGNNFNLKDYQIVNGCQTSHVLYLNRSNSDIDSMYVPIRIIESEDDDVKNKIIVATNSQTEVRREQLIALSEFQKELEKYYSAMSGPGKLYYERQSKQYAGDSTVPKNCIVSIPVQIISFTSMFLDEPHNVRRYYSKILENVTKMGKGIFASDHKLVTYYTSALAYIKLEELFRKGLIDVSFRKAKHHLLLTFRLMAEERNRPALNTIDIEHYCQALNNKLLDKERCLSIFRAACEIILETTPNKHLYDRHINITLTKNIASRLRKFIKIRPDKVDLQSQSKSQIVKSRN
jgi:AIPR protein